MSWFSRIFGREQKRYASLEGYGDYLCDIVGESYYQDALADLVGGKTEDGHEFECVALLKCEPDNPHDRTAIGIYIDGRKVGSLNRGQSKALTGIFRKQGIDGAYANAMIVGGWSRRSGSDEGHFGVKLDIPIK